MSGSDSADGGQGPAKTEIQKRWETRAEKEVNRIKLESKTKTTNAIARVWAKNRQNIKLSKENQAPSHGPLVPIPKVALCSETSSGQSSGDEEDTHRKKRRVFAKVTSSEKSNKTQMVEVKMMDEVKQYPKMITWAFISRNILTEDDNHINIPYFGDEVIDQDSHFIESFETNVSNNMKLFEEEDEDSLYLSLVTSLTNLKLQDQDVSNDGDSELLSQPLSEFQQQWHLQSCADKKLPGLVIFQAIASKYPDYGTVEELIKRFRKLQDEKTGKNLIANIDSAEAEAVTAERALHSYKLLLCQRCFMYDCPLHNDPVVEESLSLGQGRGEVPLSSSPCSAECYLNLPGVQALMSPRSQPGTARDTESLYQPELAKAAARKLVGGKPSDKIWVNSEVTLFRILVKSFPGNWCAVAQVMMTKTCRAVFEFSKKELGTDGGIKRSTSKDRRGGAGGGGGAPQKNNKKKHSKTKQAALYKGHSQDGKRESSQPFRPCHHPGLPCTELSCSCRQSGNFCEKFCYCASDCTHRFPGCKCKSRCTTNACACFLASRECDLDLCSSCLEGGLEWNPETKTCRNVMIQYDLGKRLLVAPSDIAGWGCFIGEKAAKNEFIAEYVGELISQEESERRGKIYDKAKCSYMFNLNEAFCVDAARMGGKIRFANHSSKPNCKVKILMVNGDHRIGIYANKNIEEGEELFFNYGKDFHGHDIN